MSFNKTLAEVKDAGEDFEWYPTTREIVQRMNIDLETIGHFKMLDVGAGNGNLFNLLEELNPTVLGEYGNPKQKRNFTKYAIEKSQILINKMADDIFIIGTDFYQQSFIDKEMDIVFCNPPYSEFMEWTIKLIKESNCKSLYLVIPDRWETEEIKEIIKQRKAEYRVLGDYSFVDSEYRKARANVQLVKVDYTPKMRGYNKCQSDPFDLWFREHFNIKAEDKKESEYKRESKKKQQTRELMNKDKVVDSLVTLYIKELEVLIQNYKAVESLDSDILSELNISVEGLKESLKSKIKGLKNLYWKELFDNLTTITEKLTSSSRRSLLDVLFKHTSVDFTHENVYSIVIWAIKNANNYIDSQLVILYKEMTNPKGIKAYKSNRRMLDDTWRYNRTDTFKDGKYSLDYRCVYSYASSFINGDRAGSYLTESGTNFIKDIFAVASNLGFKVENDLVSGYRGSPWEYSKNTSFYFDSGKQEFMQIKFYMNGNAHIKFNKTFMKKLNIEVARLTGWIKSPKEASEELEIPIDEAMAYFKSNTQLLGSNVKLLG